MAGGGGMPAGACPMGTGDQFSGCTGKGAPWAGGGAFGPNTRPRGKQAGDGGGSSQGQVTTGVGSARKTNQLGRGLDS